LLAAGSLATTQAVISWIRRDLDRHADLAQGAGKDLRHCDYLFEAAAYIGRVSQAVQKENEAALQKSGSSGSASFILGGQIGSEPHGLYLIYPQGNAIMATPETPFLQIGESKYGKPPLDTIGNTNLSLEDAARLCLISQVLTQRSNLSVGPPFELALIPAGALAIAQQHKIEADDADLATMIDISGVMPSGRPFTGCPDSPGKEPLAAELQGLQVRNLDFALATSPCRLLW
jgi:putative proteasome-type protease